MENDSLAVRLHHKGIFTRTKYVDGHHEIFYEDPDKFSYAVLMEFVKDMKYKEIGGVYVYNNGWKLLQDDKTLGEYIKGKTEEIDFYIDTFVDITVPAMKQMQPHVVVRPRSSPSLKAREKKTEKRTFVTIKNINAEKNQKLKDMKVDKERRISTRKKLEFNHTDTSLQSEELIGLSDYLKQYVHTEGEGPEKEKPKQLQKNTRGSQKEKACDEIVKGVEGQGCNEYEMRRNETISKNKEKLKQLGLLRNEPAKSCQKDKRKGKITSEAEGESEYIPNDNDAEPEPQSDEEDAIVTSKVRIYLIYASIYIYSTSVD